MQPMRHSSKSTVQIMSCCLKAMSFGSVLPNARNSLFSWWGAQYPSSPRMVFCFKWLKKYISPDLMCLKTTCRVPLACDRLVEPWVTKQEHGASDAPFPANVLRVRICPAVSCTEAPLLSRRSRFTCTQCRSRQAHPPDLGQSPSVKKTPCSGSATRCIFFQSHVDNIDWNHKPWLLKPKK